jgi:hypothetical protein
MFCCLYDDDDVVDAMEEGLKANADQGRCCEPQFDSQLPLYFMLLEHSLFCKSVSHVAKCGIWNQTSLLPKGEIMKMLLRS